MRLRIASATQQAQGMTVGFATFLRGDRMFGMLYRCLSKVETKSEGESEVWVGNSRRHGAANRETRK